MLAEEIIKILHLKPLPFEGGFFRETYRSDEIIEKRFLPSRYGSSKPYYTAIYYLITSNTFSYIHRLPTDEIFHFYLGDPVIMLQLHPNGEKEEIIIGNDILNGEIPQILVPKNVWQGCMLKDGGNFALMGTTMSPGFDFSDLEIGKRDELIEKYPQAKDLILKLTKL